MLSMYDLGVYREPSVEPKFHFTLFRVGFLPQQKHNATEMQIHSNVLYFQKNE